MAGHTFYVTTAGLARLITDIYELSTGMSGIVTGEYIRARPGNRPGLFRVTVDKHQYKALTNEFVHDAVESRYQREEENGTPTRTH